MFICFIAVLEKKVQNYFTPFWGMVIFDLYCTSNLTIAKKNPEHYINHLPHKYSPLKLNG
jgi:hypothetical protein